MATAALIACAGAAMPLAQAATIIKANTTDPLDSPFSWVGDIAPTSIDIARWNNTVTGANSTTTGDLGASFGQIQLVNPGGLVTINPGTIGLTLAGVDGVGIDMSAATQNLVINAPLTLTGNQQWNLAAGRTLTIAGTTAFNQGTSNITLNGLGTVLFQPTFGTVANATADGSVTVNGGTLDIFSGNSSGSPGLTNILSPLTTLVAGGGTIHHRVGSNVGTFTQSYNGLTISGGGTAFTQGRGANSTMVVNFGGITRQVGGTANLAPTSNNSGFRTSTANTNGIISGGLTLNGTDFAQAANATTNISAAAYTTDTWGGVTNTTVVADSTQTDATTNSLRFATAAANTLTLAGTNTLTSGGLLVSSAVGAFDKIITGGTLLGAAGADLIVHQNNTGGTLTISSTIADNTSATALTKAGAGTLVLAGNNTFTGGVFINAGTIRLGSTGALNSGTPNLVTFTNNSSGVLTLNGFDVTISGLRTSTVVAATRPIVQNANATSSMLTINNALDRTFAGTVQDGAGGGSLSLTKTGVGTQTLTGTLSYTGTTTVSQGTLSVKNNLVSSITVGSGATLDVAGVVGGQVLASGKTLSGSGSILGSVTLGNNALATPGGVGSVGTLSINTLNLNNGSVTNFEFGVGNDKFNVSSALAFGVFSSGGFNLLTTGGGQLLTTGTAFTLFDYTGGTLSGFSNLSSSLILNPVGGLTYAFNNDTLNKRITLTLSGTPAVSSNWILDSAVGNWSSSANWSGGVIPGNATETANFVATNPNNPAHTVNLDSNRTVGSIAFNSATAYTLSGANTLTLNNGVNNSQISVANGSHLMATALNLVSATSVSVANSSDVLTISGNIGGAPTGGLIKSGDGTLVLSGTNTYSGGTSIIGGTLSFSSLSNLGSDGISLAGGRLLYGTGNTTDISSRTVTIGAGNGIFDVGANNVVYASPIGNNGAGALIKQGVGSLGLALNNTFTGGVIIKAGTLDILSGTSLGPEALTPVADLVFDPGVGNVATLRLSGASVLGVNRNVALSSGAAVFNTNAFDLSIAGALSGTGLLHKVGEGNLTLTGATNSVNATGGVTVDAGNIVVTNTGNLPSGIITLNGTGGISVGTTPTFNNIVVNGADTRITKTGNGQIMTIQAVTGSGKLTLANPYVTDLAGDLTTFTGTIALTTGSYRLNGTTGGTNLTLDLTGGVSVRNAAATITIGQLLGAGTLAGSGGGATQSVTYAIGGKTVSGTPVDSTYSGVIANGVGAVSVSKVGLSTLTLTGISTYTGTTTVNSGRLILNGSLAATSVVTVGFGATMSGTGSAGPISVNGTLQPGNSIGTISGAGLTVGATGTLDIELGISAGLPVNDRVHVTNDVSLNDGSNLQLTLFTGLDTPAINDVFFLVVNDSANPVNGVFSQLNGSFTDLAEGSWFQWNSQEYQITYQAHAEGSSFFGGNDIAIKAVPEPSTIALLLGGAGMLALVARRRRRA